MFNICISHQRTITVAGHLLHPDLQDCARRCFVESFIYGSTEKKSGAKMAPPWSGFGKRLHFLKVEPIFSLVIMFEEIQYFALGLFKEPKWLSSYLVCCVPLWLPRNLNSFELFPDIFRYSSDNLQERATPVVEYKDICREW